MNRREFNRLAVATVGGFLLPGLGGCGTMRSFNRFAGVIETQDDAPCARVPLDQYRQVTPGYTQDIGVPRIATHR